MMQFKQLKTEAVLKLVEEAVAEKAFLTSVGKRDFSVEKFLEYANGSGNMVFGLTDGGESIGFIVLFLSGSQADIGPMYIGREFRGKGYGKKQVEEVIMWSKQKGYKSIYTKTWGQNLSSQAVFTSLGFKVTNVVSNARVNGDSTVELRLTF